MIRRFVVVLIACYLVLSAMNITHYQMQRAITLYGQRYRVTSIHLDGVTARGVGGRRGGETITLTANPPLWSYVGNERDRILLPVIVGQRVYTLQLVGEEAVHRTVTRLPTGEYEAIYSANLGRELFHWLIDQYHQNRTFTSYARNLFLCAVFIPVGLALLFFPDSFRKWGDSYMNADYDVPISRNRIFQALGGAVILTVFLFNALIFF